MPAKANILIAGPTASGKSALALAMAERLGASVVNADALQVYACWRVLTARPRVEDEARVPHRLYGHIDAAARYSVGHWLREVRALIATGAPLVIVGGTGLYLSSLLSGLPEIPEIPAEVRAAGDAIRLAEGAAGFLPTLAARDPTILPRIDTMNPARLQRAWEVVTATDRPLSAWQDDPAEPLLRVEETERILLDPPRDWLAARIAARFRAMLSDGALEECRRLRASGWDPTLPSSRALGADALMAHLDGAMSLEDATEAAEAATRQYAKRQRTWFRARMKDWLRINPAIQADIDDISSKILTDAPTPREN